MTWRISYMLNKIVEPEDILINWSNHVAEQIEEIRVSSIVIDNWNSLPEYVVTSQSTNEFKSNLNNHWRNHPKKFGE